MQQNKKWEWTSEQEKAFDFARKAISSVWVLVHYDPSKPVKLAVDASQSDVRAVISHILENGTEKPIVFAS